MSWRLIFTLSLLGLAMAIATVFVVRPEIEAYAWLGILALAGLAIAKRAPGKYFTHGLCVSMIGSVWMTALHLALFDRYVAGHAHEMAMAAQVSHRLIHDPGSPRAVLAVAGPSVGLAIGLLLGVFAVLASKFVVSSHSEYAGW